MGMVNLEKAKGFDRVQNYPQTLRHADVAATKLKQLKDRPVELIDEALKSKYNALLFMGRDREALECAKEWYCLWPTKHTHPPAIDASFALIQSCMFNKEFFDAALYARTLWETITMSRDSHIPDHQLQEFTARGALELARALWQLAVHGSMPAEEKQEVGVEAIMLARKALEINTQLRGAESKEVANSMGTLADVVVYFNNADDEEVLRLYEQAKVIYTRIEGSLSPNVAATVNNMSFMYRKRAVGAHAANDLDRFVTNLELALPHFREAARIYGAINHVEEANEAIRDIARIEELLRQVAAERGAATRR